MIKTTSSFNLQSAVSSEGKIPLGERGKPRLSSRGTPTVDQPRGSSRQFHPSLLVRVLGFQSCGQLQIAVVLCISRTVLLSLTLETDDGLFSGQRTLLYVQIPSRSSSQFVGWVDRFRSCHRSQEPPRGLEAMFQARSNPILKSTRACSKHTQG